MTTIWLASFPRLLQIVRWVCSIGFLAGTYTHLKGILAHGFLATPVPLAIGVYWDTLTMLDPLTILPIVGATKGRPLDGGGHYGVRYQCEYAGLLSRVFWAAFSLYGSSTLIRVVVIWPVRVPKRSARVFQLYQAGAEFNNLLTPSFDSSLYKRYKR